MKKIFNLLLVTFCMMNYSYATPIQVGTAIPDFTVPLADQSGVLDQAALQGKITIIEFWATWCGPCIGAMQHLDELRSQYPEELQVIAVSRESFDRVQGFMKQKNFDFTFAIDSADILNSYFPHRIIPHSVLIDQNGVVRAITEPTNIKSPIVQKLLYQGSINLPLKAENTDFDYAADYFKADTNTLRSFVVQPSIPGIGTFSKQPDRGPFLNRRISMHNYLIDGMYRMAYQTSSYRMVYEMDESLFDYSNSDHKYCLDIIVAPEEKTQLYPILIDKLAETFPLKTRLEKRMTEVAVLYRIDSIEVNLPEGEPGTNMIARGDYFKDNNASFADLANYLESFGIVGMAVLDETGDPNIYQIDLHFSPEKKGSFQAALKEMGIGIKKAQRTIDVLILFED